MDQNPISIEGGGLIKITAQLAQDQIDSIDGLARAKRLSRPGMIRQLLDLGIAEQRERDRMIEAARGIPA